MNTKEFNNWIESVCYTEWMEWANRPSEKRKGRNNILPEIINYLNKHLEEFNEQALTIEKRTQILVPCVSPRTWLAASETLIDQCLENHFGKKYESVSALPKDEIIHHLIGIIGENAAKRFADYMIGK